MILRSALLAKHNEPSILYTEQSCGPKKLESLCNFVCFVLNSSSFIRTVWPAGTTLAPSEMKSLVLKQTFPWNS